MAVRLSTLATSFELSLRAENKSPRTIEKYLVTLRQFTESLPLKGDTDVAKVTRDDVRRWLDGMRDRVSPSTVQLRHVALRQFWKWAEREGEANDLMTGMVAPAVPAQPVPVIDDDTITKLLKVC